MDNQKLLDLENKFILLKNYGKSFDEAKEMLPSVDSKLLRQWDNAYENEIQRLKKDGLEGVASITMKNGNGKYLYNNSFNFQIRQLDKIRLEMRSTILAKPELEKKKKEHLEVFDKYFQDIELTYELVDENLGSFRTPCSYKLNVDNINSVELTKKAEEAISFYCNHFLKIEIFLEKLNLIKEESELWYISFENILPFAIKQLKVKNFQSIQDVSIDNLNTDAQWIFLTGENSKGKSTILQAIALSLTGETEIVSKKDENFAIEYKDLNDNKILNFWDKRHFKPFQHLACYGPSRLLLQTDRSQNEVDEKSSTTYHLFNPDGILLNIEFELFKWYYKKDRRFQTVVEILKKMIPTIQDIGLDEKNDKIFYIEKEGLERLSFNELASGYRSLIAMIGDMMIRLFKTQPTVKNPSDLAGIVLIDELDLHWHPKWQRRLPTLLSEIFPKVQFIASTHSEIPLLGAPQYSIFLKVTRTLVEGIKVEKIDIDLSNLLPNHVLTSALFDMDLDEISAETHQNKSALKTEDTMSEILENKDIDERLKAFELSNATFSDTLFD